MLAASNILGTLIGLLAAIAPIAIAAQPLLISDIPPPGHAAGSSWVPQSSLRQQWSQVGHEKAGGTHQQRHRAQHARARNLLLQVCSAIATDALPALRTSDQACLVGKRRLTRPSSEPCFKGSTLSMSCCRSSRHHQRRRAPQRGAAAPSCSAWRCTGCTCSRRSPTPFVSSPIQRSGRMPCRSLRR